MPHSHYPRDCFNMAFMGDGEVATLRYTPPTDRENAALHAENARLVEELRQANIKIGGLQNNLDRVIVQAAHTHKTNRDLVGRNQRLASQRDELRNEILLLKGVK